MDGWASTAQFHVLSESLGLTAPMNATVTMVPRVIQWMENANARLGMQEIGVKTTAQKDTTEKTVIKHANVNLKIICVILRMDASVSLDMEATTVQLQ